MKEILFAELMFLAFLVQTHEDNELFYIIPNLHSNLNYSHNQSHLTFQQFVNSYDDFQENATLVFLTGYHTFTEDDENLVFNTYLAMVGINTEVIIHDIILTFFDVQTLQIENLTLSNGFFQMLGTSQLGLFSITAINFIIEIHQVTAAEMHSCKFFNGTSPLFTDKSNVTISGNSQFLNNVNSALVSYSSTITLSGTVSFINNTGIRGGAMALYSSTLYLTTGLNVNNSAQDTGGVIHIEPDMTRNCSPKCFYKLQGHDHTRIVLHYYKNSAKFGGDNIYGTSLALCNDFNNTVVSHYFSSNVSMSSVSSDPTQVCLCDSDSQPRCKENVQSKGVYPGETFIIPAVIVGGDYGTTIGTVHASFRSTNYPSVPVLKYSHQYSQWINDISACADLQYTIYSKHIGKNFTMYLTIHLLKNFDQTTKKYDSSCSARPHSYDPRTLAFINLTILPCPIGFSLIENPSTCDCHPVLTNIGVECKIINGKSYFSWNNTLWINVNPKGFTYAKYCPLNYCEQAEKKIELEKDPSAQCAFNRAGRLCGGCKENYSLAIGSSHCIHCPNNNGLTLIIFFAAAEFLLVLFINIFHVTLTQGLLDGFIFYANIVWTYQSVLFPEGHASNIIIIFLETFIAWINLDFGIETCFVRRLTSYWKTWLQFAFPFYIWAIVGLMVFTAKHSNTLTKLYSNRAVAVLATLFFLSYMKLLRTVTSIYMFSDIDIIQYPRRSKITVWSVDGNVDYFGLPHSILLVAALIIQAFLWLPYTLTLLFYQQLQKTSHIKIFKWVTNLKPFFDVHSVPFKPAYRYIGLECYYWLEESY